jgi:hypothetical protein
MKYEKNKQKKRYEIKLLISMNKYIYICISVYINVTGGGTLSFSLRIVSLNVTDGILHKP